MCTVLLRLTPGARWPVIVGAIRDEFADRAWEPPAAHWPEPWAGLVGGRDVTAGGTWLAVDPEAEHPGVAALLNGVRRPPLDDGRVRPTRGTLALDVLRAGTAPSAEGLRDHDGFHLLLARGGQAQVWSWDGDTLHHQHLSPGDHILVNLGVDAPHDPLVPHFQPLLEALPDPVLGPRVPTSQAWEPWTDLLGGDGLDPTDPRALIVRREVDGRVYASTSATLVALSADGLRYDFSADPADAAAWFEVATPLRR